MCIIYFILFVWFWCFVINICRPTFCLDFLQLKIKINDLSNNLHTNLTQKCMYRYKDVQNCLNFVYFDSWDISTIVTS